MKLRWYWHFKKAGSLATSASAKATSFGQGRERNRDAFRVVLGGVVQFGLLSVPYPVRCAEWPTVEVIYIL